MALFQFELAPIRSIAPWGTAPDLSLHWFGLSDGHYHIDLGEHRLFEYDGRTGQPKFVNYQVARIHEDILDLLPRIIEPIPVSTAGRFVGGRLGSTLRMLHDLRVDPREPDGSIDIALEALGSRQLDTSYLSHAPKIWIWNRGETVIIEWDNRNCVVEGIPVWSSINGSLELPTDEFLNDVKDFHHRFSGAMAERVRNVCSDWNRPDVRIDFALLEREQLTRSSGLEMALQCIPPATDWAAVETILARF